MRGYFPQLRFDGSDELKRRSHHIVEVSILVGVEPVAFVVFDQLFVEFEKARWESGECVFHCECVSVDIVSVGEIIFA